MGSLASGVGGNYVFDGSTSFTVVSIATPRPGWSTAATSGIGGPFNGDFFASAGDPAGVSGPVGNGTNQAGVVLMSFSIHLDIGGCGDEYIVIRVLSGLPGLYNDETPWQNRFQLGPATGPNQFTLGAGNPGDANPHWSNHGLETLQLLIIHRGCPGDLNGDGLRNGRDIQKFTSCFFGGTGCGCADHNASGTLTTTDINIFVSNLLTNSPCP